MTINLKTATPEQINAAVAEYVAGWRYTQPSDKMGELWDNERGELELDGPSFATSADAVLPLLERQEWWSKIGHTNHVEVGYYDDGPCMAYGEAATFPMAACIALLNSKGIEVVE